jgi:hypothetical protein
MIKRIIFLTLVLIPLSYHFYVFPQEKKSLNLDDIEKLLRSGVVSNKVILKLLAERGINFIAKEEDISMLRSSGANDEVIDVIRQESIEYGKENFGNIYVESDPSGAKVTIDGYTYDRKTPFQIEKLSPGIKKLIVDGVEGYGKYKGEVSIKSSRTTSIKAILPPQLFSITIYTDIPFTKVHLTGDMYKRKDMGITGYYSPIIVKSLKQGEYIIEVEKEDYLPIK